MRKSTGAVWVVGLAMLAPVAAAAATPRPAERPVFGDVLAGSALAFRTQLLDAAPRRLAGAAWWGGTYSVPGGEHVSINISSSYPESAGLAQQWAAFFAGLPHGQELSLVRVYIAPLAEVEAMCLSSDVLGCYGGQQLVTVGDSTAGISAASVAAHEYGHHVAANRDNSPWRALDWGTKRWASAVGVCSRVAGGTAFPGDEALHYSFNPGEAFAESYRVLVQTNGAAGAYDWPIVDPSFRPSTESLDAIRADVAQPWTGPTTTTIQGTFPRRSRTWTTRITTSLDGDLGVRVKVPAGGADDVSLVTADGKTVLAQGTWDSRGGKSIAFRVCGTRSLNVRVTRTSRVAAARFVLKLSVP